MNRVRDVQNRHRRMQSHRVAAVAQVDAHQSGQAPDGVTESIEARLVEDADSDHLELRKRCL
jgi:hypothetical protein